MDQASALLALQDADTELMRLHARLDKLPEKRAILEIRAKRRDVEALRGKADLLISKLTSELKARTDEIDTLIEKIDGEQAKLMSTSDHRTVQSLTREMSGLKKRKDTVEEQAIVLEERLEKASEQVSKIDAALGQLDTQEAAYVANFKKVGSGIQRQIRAKESDRATYAGGLDADLLASYEEARSSKAGIGVGRLEGNTCSACRMSLPAERLARLVADDTEVASCPACRRLLVVHYEASES